MASFAYPAAANEAQGFAPDQTAPDNIELTDAVEVDPPKPGEINKAELEDLETIASHSGMSVEAAIDRYAWNDDFASEVAAIRKASPEAFTGAEIVDGSHAWVAFSSGAPKVAQALIDAFGSHHEGVDVTVRTDLGFTEAELERAIETVYYAILESEAVRDASASFDFETGLIATTVVLASTAQDSVLADLRGIAERKLTDEADTRMIERITVSVVQSESPVLGTDDAGATVHMGGEDITGCTTGFGTRRISDGFRGVATAGHCGNTQTDDGYSLVYAGGHEGTHGDFQWHFGPRTETDNFYSGSTTVTEVNLRDVVAMRSPVVGQSLCRNGVTSHKDCQEVRKVGVCSGGECNLVQMGSDLSAGGDSGGSVFWGNYAYGFHKGEMFDPWPFDRDVFSRADRIDNALGITIATW